MVNNHYFLRLPAFAIFIILMAPSQATAVDGRQKRDLLHERTAAVEGRAKLDELLQKAVAAYAGVTSYTGIFDKRELLSGSRVLVQRNILFKFMKPGSLYMKWTDGGENSAEVLYVPGENDGKLLMHKGGLMRFINLSLEPSGRLAMRDNRHPVTEAGIGAILERIVNDYRRSAKEPESRIRYMGRHLLDGGSWADAVSGTFPKEKGFYAGRVNAFFSVENHLPVLVTVFGWDGTLLEEYRFRELDLDAGLTRLDFSRENPEYKFQSNKK